MPGVRAVILAAGASKRLGFPKALARFGRRSALQIACDNVQAAGLGRPIVVLGSAAELMRPYAEECRAIVVVNRRWETGQLSSFKAGLKMLPAKVPGFMLYPVDYPLVKTAHLRMLVAAMRVRTDRDIFCPSHAGQGGHPVLFRGALRREFVRLGAGRTARDVVYRDPSRICFVPRGASAIRADLDTPRQYARLRSRFGR